MCNNTAYKKWAEVQPNLETINYYEAEAGDTETRSTSKLSIATQTMWIDYERGVYFEIKKVMG